MTGSTTPDWVSAKLLEGVAGLVNPPVNWGTIEAPRLGIFAPYTLEARQPWYGYLTAADQAAFDEAWPPIVAWFQEAIEKFADHHPVQPLLLPGAPHYVYITHEADVVRAMRPFFGSDRRGGPPTTTSPDPRPAPAIRGHGSSPRGQTTSWCITGDTSHVVAASGANIWHVPKGPMSHDLSKSVEAIRGYTRGNYGERVTFRGG